MRKLIVFLILITLFACDKPIISNKKNIGVVAEVNKEQIFLTDIEKMLDLKLAGHYSNNIATKEELQEMYVEIVNELIVQKLIHQSLVKNSIVINYAKVNNIEQNILSDYFSTDYKEIFKEEGIDYDFWKSQILAYYEKYVFFESILRPKASLSIEEIETKYTQKLNNYLANAIYDINIYRSAEQNELIKYQTNKIADVTKLKMRATAYDLPEEVRTELSKLALNTYSKIYRDSDGYFYFEIINKEPKTDPNILEVYNNVEQELIEPMLREEFDIWLEQALLNSNIKISKTLLNVS